MARKKKESLENINKAWTEIYSFRHSYNMTETEAEALATDMIDYVQRDPLILKIDHYLNRRKILRSSFYGWKEKFPALQRALEYFNQIIAERREVGALTGKYPVNAIMPYMHIWDADYKEAIAWKASVEKKEDQMQGAVILVEAEPVASSPLVEDKKHEM